MGEVIKKGSNPITIPIVIFILTVIGTIGIYGYTYYLETENNKLDDKISERQVEIDKINKNKNIKVYNLIKENKLIINKMESYSKITRLITSLSDIERNYNLNIEGFNYSNGVITTQASTNIKKSYSPNKIVSEFIREYRKDEKSDFKLPFISKIDGFDSIKFNLKLEVKDNLIIK